MLKIEFLYYDKTDCRRCIATHKSVMQSIRETKAKVKLIEKKLPKSKTDVSPSVLVNGRDVEKILHGKVKLKTNSCLDCCDTTGPVQCRIFLYKGKRYEYIPAGMIKDAIRAALQKRGD